MKIENKIESFIGDTPLLKLDVHNPLIEIFLKLEKFNPGQSMKDRMALNMINHAERMGLLQSGGTIIESSSGNTAIGLAMISASRGYHFIAVVDNHASVEKIRIIKAYGGEIKVVGDGYAEDEVAVVERERVAFEISKEIPNSIFFGQADNLANREGYINTLAVELHSSLGQIDYVFGCIGTGGSLCGTAMGLKKLIPDIKVVAVEPEGSIIFDGKPKPYFQSGTGNPQGADIPKNIDYGLIDKNLFASDSEAFSTCHFMAKRKGILIGGSSGGVLYKAIEYAFPLEKMTRIVVIIPDGGEKYVSTIFNDEWIEARNIIDPNVVNKLERMVVCQKVKKKNLE